MSRDIFHYKLGKAKDSLRRSRGLERLFKRWDTYLQKLFADLGGEYYWTVVDEQDIKTIDELAEMSRKVMSDPRTAEVMKNYHDCVQKGGTLQSRVIHRSGFIGCTLEIQVTEISSMS